MKETRRELIDDFLSRKRLALVGVSRDPKDFSRRLMQELIGRGYEVHPVNPMTPELDGRPCYPRVQEIETSVDGALVLTTPEVTETVVRDCAEAGIKLIWMQRGAGTGSVSRAAVEFCCANGLKVIPGLYPYMFFPQTQFFHRLHGFVLKLVGQYPK